MTAAELEGRRAVVTGAADGIGRATALLLAARGASVVVADIDEIGVEHTARLIDKDGGTALAVRADISDEDGVRTLMQTAVDAFGGLDLAVNNAGIFGQLARVDAVEPDEWRRVLDVNLTGTFLSMKYELPLLVAAGGGAIVNTASVAGRQGFAGQSAYVTSKHGVIGLTRCAAMEYGRKGVRVNAVCPGVVETKMLGQVTDERAEALTESTPLRRPAQPAEIAETIAWLCSDRASYTSGAEIVADGAMTVG